MCTWETKLKDESFLRILAAAAGTDPASHCGLSSLHSLLIVVRRDKEEERILFMRCFIFCLKITDPHSCSGVVATSFLHVFVPLFRSSFSEEKASSVMRQTLECGGRGGCHCGGGAGAGRRRRRRRCPRRPRILCLSTTRAKTATATTTTTTAKLQKEKDCSYVKSN